MTPLGTEKRLVVFFALAYALAWLCWLPAGFSKNIGTGLFDYDYPRVMLDVGTFAPLAAALLAHWHFERGWPTFKRVSSRMVIGLLLAPVLMLMGKAIIPIAVLAKAPLADMNWSIGFVLGQSFLIATLFEGPVGEEFGWRGYALPKLESLFGPLKASFSMGLLWAGWHLPLFLVKDYSSSGPGTFFLVLIPVSVVMSYLFNVSNGSILVAIFAHSVFNGANVTIQMLIDNNPIRNAFSPELAVALGMFVVALILALMTRGNLASKTLTVFSQPNTAEPRCI